MCRSGAMKRLNVFLSASPACVLKNFNWPALCASVSIASILPRNRGRSLALRAMPVAAGIVRDQRMAACRVLAARDMPAERRRAAALDCAHHLQLVEARMAAVGLAPIGTVRAEDVRELQNRPNHDRRRYRAGGFSASRFACLWRGVLRRASGLSILAMSPVATRV